MIKEFLEQTILSEFDKIKIPVNDRLSVRSYDEVYPNHSIDKGTFFIQLNYGGLDLYDRKNECLCSFLDFWYDPKNECINHINFCLKKDLKGKGYGRKLVESMHEFGKIMGCKSSFVYLNCNKSFWDHMDYKKVNDSCYEKKLI